MHSMPFSAGKVSQTSGDCVTRSDQMTSPSAHSFYAVWRQIAGWVGLWVGLVAFYAATAILTAEVWEREWLPIGHMLKRTAQKKTCAAAP